MFTVTFQNMVYHTHSGTTNIHRVNLLNQNMLVLEGVSLAVAYTTNSVCFVCCRRRIDQLRRRRQHRRFESIRCHFTMKSDSMMFSQAIGCICFPEICCRYCFHVLSLFYALELYFKDSQSLPMLFCMCMDLVSNVFFAIWLTQRWH